MYVSRSYTSIIFAYITLYMCLYKMTAIEKTKTDNVLILLLRQFSPDLRLRKQGKEKKKVDKVLLFVAADDKIYR